MIDMNTFKEKLERLRAQAKEEPLRCSQYCLECDEFYLNDVNMPEECMLDHVTIHSCMDNAGFDNWLECIEYLDGQGVIADD